MRRALRNPLVLALATIVPITLACLGGNRFSDQREVCDAYLDCISELSATEFPAISAAYGDDSACWDSEEAADQCANACLTASEALEGCVITDPDGPDPIDPVGIWTADRIRFDDTLGEEDATLPGPVLLGEDLYYDGAIGLLLVDDGSGWLTNEGELIDNGTVVEQIDISAASSWTVTTARSFMLNVTENHVIEGGQMICTSVNDGHTTIICAQGTIGEDFAEIRFNR